MRIFESGYSESFDGPGTRLIYYLKGCNLRCDWCGAPESLSNAAEKMFYPERTVTVGKEITPEEIVRKAVAAGDFISGVTFGGGEPTLQASELLKTIALLHAEHLHCAVESNASTADYPSVAAAVDFLYSDLKTLDREIFASRVSPDLTLLDRIQCNLRFAAAKQEHLVLRIPVVTGLNDSEELQRPLVDFCVELQKLSPNGKLKVELLRQHHLALPKYEALRRPCRCRNDIVPPRKTLEQFTDKLINHNIDATFFG